MTTDQPKPTNSVKETFIFFTITLGICWLVLWGPLVVFKVPVMSFVSNVKGPAWSRVPPSRMPGRCPLLKHRNSNEPYGALHFISRRD